MVCDALMAGHLAGWKSFFGNLALMAGHLAGWKRFEPNKKMKIKIDKCLIFLKKFEPDAFALIRFFTSWETSDT